MVHSFDSGHWLPSTAVREIRCVGLVFGLFLEYFRRPSATAVVNDLDHNIEQSAPKWLYTEPRNTPNGQKLMS
jgi:hypothetical protein